MLGIESHQELHAMRVLRGRKNVVHMIQVRLQTEDQGSVTTYERRI